MARLSRRFLFLPIHHWPGPRSLATTNGVSVDVLSSGYWDVSLHRVCFHNLWIQLWIQLKLWVSPFGNLWIKGCSPLPKAYRKVLRPSSPLDTKASTKCPYHTWESPCTGIKRIFTCFILVQIKSTQNWDLRFVGKRWCLLADNIIFMTTLILKKSMIDRSSIIHNVQPAFIKRFLNTGWKTDSLSIFRVITFIV